MPPNETTVLLTNYREKHIISSGRSGYGGNGHLTQAPSSTHVVEVSKDSTEYEPIFSINDYSSALTLAELLPFQDDPWWQRLRRILFSTFWLILLMCLIIAFLMAYLQSGQLSCSGQSPTTTLLPNETILTATTTTTTKSLIPPLPSIAEMLTSQLLATSGKISPP